MKSNPVGLGVVIAQILLPVFAGETIPKKEQSDGKLIPNGAISPLRNKVWLLGVRTEAHNAISEEFLF